MQLQTSQRASDRITATRTLRAVVSGEVAAACVAMSFGCGESGARARAAFGIWRRPE